MSSDPLDTPVSEIGLSARTAARLTSANMPLVRDLVQRTEAYLLKTKDIGRDRLAEIKEALAKLGLSLGTRLPKPADEAPPAPPSEIALRFLAGDAETIDALARGDAATWQAWLEHLVSRKPPHAEPGLVERMLAREPSPARWIEIASRTLFDIDSNVFFTSKSALQPFQAWLGDGVIAATGPTSTVSIELRLDREVREANGAAAAGAIVADIRQTRASDELLADALVLWARRLAEESEHAAAIDVLIEAEGLFERLGNDSAKGVARRLRGARLLQLKRLDEAFAILDREMAGRARGLTVGAQRFSGSPDDKWDAALAEAATIAAWAAATTPEWVRALGGIAQHADSTSKRSLWQRFERALVAMVDASANPGSDLEVVIRQAKQRKLNKTAKAASVLAEERGIELVANPSFG